MDTPIVGITMASLAALEGVGGPHPESSVVGLRYVRAISATGAVPWPIPVVPDAPLLGSLYEHLDGVVLTGGSDIRPDRYGGREHPAVDGGDADRDEVERLLAAWAMRDGKPLLGICRGMQMINVTRGGTLVPHLDCADGSGLKHDNFPLALYPRDLPAHGVDVIPGSRAATALGATSLTVNSIHHQAVERPGDGLVVSAHSSDGVPEAVEDPTLPFCLGVQWHPEEMPHHPASRSLFAAFRHACVAWAGRSPAEPRGWLAAG